MTVASEDPTTQEPAEMPVAEVPTPIEQTTMTEVPLPEIVSEVIEPTPQPVSEPLEPPIVATPESIPIETPPEPGPLPEPITTPAPPAADTPATPAPPVVTVDEPAIEQLAPAPAPEPQPVPTPVTNPEPANVGGIPPAVLALTDAELKIAAAYYLQKNQQVIARKGVEARQKRMHDRLSAIQAYLQVNGSSQIPRMSRELNLSPGLTAHYLQILVKQHKVKAEGWSKNRRYSL